MVDVKYTPDRAVVRVSGVIEEDMMLPLVAAMQQLHHEYFYQEWRSTTSILMVISNVNTLFLS